MAHPPLAEATMPVPPPPKPTQVAAVLLWARELLEERQHDQLPSKVADILEVAQAGRSQSYVVLGRLKEAVPTLEGPTGRPYVKLDTAAAAEVTRQVRDFLMDNPGAVSGRGTRRHYAPAFRGFVAQLLGSEGPGAPLTLEQAADAVGVSMGTLKDWRKRPLSAAAEPAPKVEDVRAPDPKLTTILSEWRSWKGNFSAFCDHLRNDLLLPYGRTYISSVLVQAGVHEPKPRKRSRPSWGRESFLKLFPGAQWIGDGKTLVFELDGQRFAFNFEAIVDTDSNAVVAARVSDVEDEAAVIEAYEQGLETVEGVVPTALSLDNKAANHTVGVEEAVAPTLVLPTTLGRGQAKAPVEGAFGLFSQTAPPLRVAGNTTRQLACSMVTLLVTLWAWTRNHKPRKLLNGVTPAQHYHGAHVDAEDIARAQAWIRQMRRRVDRARRTAARRADPSRVQLLRDALREFGIDDPDDRLAVDLARHSREAIARAISIYRGYVQRGTLPDTHLPGRYLGGIVSKIDEVLELELYAKNLRETRIHLRDLTLKAVAADIDRIRNNFAGADRPLQFVQLAIETESRLALQMYIDEAARELAGLQPHVADAIAAALVPHLANARHMPKDQRQRAISALVEAVHVA